MFKISLAMCSGSIHCTTRSVVIQIKLKTAYEDSLVEIDQRVA